MPMRTRSPRKIVAPSANLDGKMVSVRGCTPSSLPPKLARMNVVLDGHHTRAMNSRRVADEGPSRPSMLRSLRASAVASDNKSRLQPSPAAASILRASMPPRDSDCVSARDARPSTLAAAPPTPMPPLLPMPPLPLLWPALMAFGVLQTLSSSEPSIMLDMSLTGLPPLVSGRLGALWLWMRCSPKRPSQPPADRTASHSCTETCLHAGCADSASGHLALSSSPCAVVSVSHRIYHICL
eukprot:366002-Chlamydomonas_euryale.AAC.3